MAPTDLTIRRQLSRFEKAAFKQVEEALGGLDQLIITIAQAPPSALSTYVLGAIGQAEAHHKQGRPTLATLCADGGISLGELMQVVYDGQLIKSQIQARQHVAAKLPEVTKEQMRIAAPYEDDCNICLGSGATEENEPCRRCQGTGRLTYKPDPQDAERALKLGGLLGGPKGP